MKKAGTNGPPPHTARGASGYHPSRSEEVSGDSQDREGPEEEEPRADPSSETGQGMKKVQVSGRSQERRKAQGQHPT